jgi:hypothetical protein
VVAQSPERFAGGQLSGEYVIAVDLSLDLANKPADDRAVEASSNTSK